MLENLSNTALMDRMGQAVRTERKITHLVLQCIAEIYRRKLFLERAYPSLYEMLVQEYGYSPTAALRRIDAARLLREVPEVATQLESGAVNLSQIALVQQSFKQAEKSGNQIGNTELKKQLINKIEYASHQKTQVIIAQELGIEPPIINKLKTHADESVTLTVTFTKQQMEQLSSARDLISHSVPTGNWSEVFVHLAHQELRKKTKICRPSSVKNTAKDSKQNETGSSTNNNQNSKAQPGITVRRSIRPNLRKELLNSNATCSFEDPMTRQKCNSRRMLQVDHIQPVWAGGTNHPKNLQVLCAGHNHLKYRTESRTTIPNRR